MRDITDIQRILNDYDAYLSVEKGMAEKHPRGLSP